jgi:CelD/BcsL family acetyltransferase involved in cellulose biosynthesis
MLRLELIATAAALEQLRQPWRELWGRCPEATPFQSPAWLIPWWEVFGAGAELYTLAVYEGERLAGLFPLFLRGRPPRLHLLGWGISDYLDVLIEPALRWPALQAAFDFLLGQRQRWQEADFGDLPASSCLLSTALPGVAVAVRTAAVCPVVSLPSSVAAFHAGLDRRHRQHLSQARRRIAERFAVRLAVTGPADLGQGLEELYALHGARWASRDGPGVLGEQAIRAFHRRAAPGLLEGGWLRLYRLHFDDTPAAAIYALAGPGRMYGYIGGFDPALERFSPGMTALDLVIGDAIGRGVAEFDFLRGAEPYKYLWGARDRPSYALTLRPAAPGEKEAER